MVNLNSQMQGVVTAQPDYLTVLIGGNDLCTDTTAQMTSVTSFRGQFIQAMDTLAAGSPGTRVFVASIPDVYQLWALFNSSFWARTVWSLGSICQSLLANPRSTATADVQRRAEVAQRNVDYNTVLAEVCALYAQCRFDDNAVYDVQFSRSDVSGDYFHPSIAGQAKLSAVTWAASYWPNGGPAPDAPPTAAFSTVSCTELTCSFDASGSSDDGGISGYAWTFGDGGSSTGVAASHTFSGDGTWDVTLEVTDTAGQTDSVTHQVTVSQSGGGTTIHLASGSGTSTARKGGWTATVSVSARDGDGAPVANATISGSWSTGGSDSCLTAADGACSFSQNMNKKVTTATWTITGITAAGYAYDSGSDAGSPVTVSAP
jgi:lysophospholipase L1-like esterase